MFCYFLGFLVLFPFIKIKKYLGCVSKIALLFAVLFKPFFFAGISRKNGPFLFKKITVFLVRGP